MVQLIHSVLCEKVQELSNGNLNYVNVFSRLYGTGTVKLELANCYKTDESVLHEAITVTDPGGSVLDRFENRLTPANNYFTSILELETEFNQPGMHFLNVEINGLQQKTLPIHVEMV